MYFVYRILGIKYRALACKSFVFIIEYKYLMSIILNFLQQQQNLLVTNI